MNSERVDHIVQFLLARAAQEDEWMARELGPIHILKYLYLADVAHAKRAAESFTGIEWRFYRFGPWSDAPLARIEPAVHSVSGVIRQMSGDFDGTRYSVHPEDAEGLERRLDALLPSSVTSTLKKAVHSFTNDTQGLLHFVYQTRPMLAAKPGDLLHFRNEPIETPTVAEPKKAETRNQEKRVEAALEEARKKVRERLDELKSQPRLVELVPAPRYDEVFVQGMRHMNDAAEVPHLEGELRFDEGVWIDGWRDPNADR